MDASKSCKTKPNLYNRPLTWAHSSAGEHLGDIEGVVGSIPTAPTMLKPSGNRGFLLFWSTLHKTNSICIFTLYL